MAALICVVTWAVFQGVHECAFLRWDDDINIVQNPHLRGLTVENLWWMFTDMEYVPRYMPLGWLSWAINIQWFGLTPLSFHLGNLLLHSLNAVLLFFLLRRLLLAAVPEGSRGEWEGARSLCSAIGALLWAVHPLRVEPVAWATDRIYSQALLFLLGSLLAYLRFLDLTHGGRRRQGWYWSSVAAFAASLLTYPLALSYVAVLILIDFFPLRRFGQGFFVPAARRVWLEKAPFVLVFGLVFAATLWARGHGSWQWERPANLEQFGLLSRVMQAFYIWAYYLWKPLLPFDLSPVYTTLGEFDPLSLRFVLSLGLVVASTLILFWKRRQWPGLFALWLCHLVVLVPFLGLTEYPHHPNDRYSYLVSITGSVLVAACLLKRWRDRSLRLKALAGAGMAAALLALLSFVQVGAWKNSEALFRHMIRKLGNDPYRSDIYWRLGMVLSSEGRMAEAEVHFKESLLLAPGTAEARVSYGDALFREGRKAEAAAQYAAALRINPSFPLPHARLAQELAGQGRFDEAMTHCQAALSMDPNCVEALNNLAWLLATCPDDKLRNGPTATALAERAAALTQHRFVQIEGTLAAAYAEAGLFAKAIEAGARAGAMASALGDTNLVARYEQELNLNAEVKSQEQTEETEREALARTHAGTFCSTKDTHAMSSDSVLSVPSCKSYFGVRAEPVSPWPGPGSARRYPFRRKVSCGLAASLAGRGSTDNAACLRCTGERDSRHQVLAEEQDRAQEAFFTLVPEPTHGLMGLGLLRATHHHRRSRR